jgi:hypothetical protein
MGAKRQNMDDDGDSHELTKATAVFAGTAKRLSYY